MEWCWTNGHLGKYRWIVKPGENFFKGIQDKMYNQNFECTKRTVAPLQNQMRSSKLSDCIKKICLTNNLSPDSWSIQMAILNFDSQMQEKCKKSSEIVDFACKSISWAKSCNAIFRKPSWEKHHTKWDGRGLSQPPTYSVELPTEYVTTIVEGPQLWLWLATIVNSTSWGPSLICILGLQAQCHYSFFGGITKHISNEVWIIEQWKINI